jgi:diguanylate cyclase (GGDEF)-like protein
MRVWRHLRHPRLLTKLIISVVVAASAAMVVQFGISYRHVESNLAVIEARRISEDLEVARGALDQIRLNLERAATGSSVSLRLADAVARGDERWIDDNVTQRLARTYGAQSVSVFDRETRPLAVAGRSLPGLVDEVAVAQSQANVVVSSYVYLENDLWLIATAPIVRQDFAQKVEGVLVLAQRVDDSFADIVKRLTSNEITFIVKGHVATTTDRRLADTLERPAALAALTDRHSLVLTDEFASKGTYLGVDGSEGLIVVSNQRAPISAAQTALLRAMLWAIVPAVALACLVAIVLSVQLGRPLRSLRAAVAAIAFGDLEQRVETSGDDEIADLGRAFNAMAERVSVAQETLRRAAVRDSLTGLLNHREFYHRLTDEIARSERSAAPLSVLMIDLDFFKEVNDTYGHLRGDAVLREVASVLTRCVREGDIVARYAGDEFAVILPGSAELDAVDIAERVRGCMKDVIRAVDVPGGEALTLSIGVATRWPGEHTATRTVELADQALYRAKQTGRDRVVVSHDVAV